LMRDGEVERDVIERRPEIVDGVTNDEWPARVRRLFDLSADDLVAGLGVRFFDKGVAASVQPVLNGLIEGVNVFIPPAELPFVSRRGHALTSP
jgi:hypothetical protein